MWSLTGTGLGFSFHAFCWLQAYRSFLRIEAGERQFLSYVHNPPVVLERGKSAGALVISHCPTSLLHSKK